MRNAILVLIIFIFITLVACSIDDKQDFYSKYTFEKVSYLSPLSSSTVDYIEEKMEGTEYTIESDLFKIAFTEDTFEVSSPIYKREEIPNALGLLCDVHAFTSNEVEYQYTIYNKDESKTHHRLYVTSDCLWIASYVDNTADGSEIIMNIYKLSRNIKS